MKKSLIAVALVCSLTAQAQDHFVKVNTDKEPIHEGKYVQTLESLSDFVCPEWFRDAKFGIWAHWGPQCQPEDGDWYARHMYVEGNGQYQYQLDAMGHPSEFGFKDWIPLWKADKWDPDALIKLYKEAGAKYFFALGNHHDNFDNYDSKYQDWNSVNMGPHKDLVGGWAEACRKYGLYLGVSVHASHAWTWYETSRGHDSKGPLKDVPYDGWLTKEDGTGTWWEGYDIQDLYEQRHPLSKNNGEWNWKAGEVTPPDQQYCDRLYNRTVDMINKYNPDIVYFDDWFLPLWPVSDVGLAIAAHLYNKSMSEHGGKNEAIVTGKGLSPEQKKIVLWDVERGAAEDIQDLPWQTCTCIGSWHYDKHRYYNDDYKSAADVVHMLADIVSKNGNLLLSIPLRGNGSPDPTEVAIVKQIGAWMAVNSESVYGTRPWIVYGEGPSVDQRNPVNSFGFNEGNVKYSAKDVRFVQKGNALYVTLMGAPEEDIVIKSLGKAWLKAHKTAPRAMKAQKIKSVELVGSAAPVAWTQTDDALAITCPASGLSEAATVFKVNLK